MPTSWAPHHAKTMKGAGEGGGGSISFIQSNLIYKMTSILEPIGSRKYFRTLSLSNLLALFYCKVDLIVLSNSFS